MGGVADYGARLAQADSAPQDWLTAGRGPQETHNSPLAMINDGNVNRLGLLWSYDLDTKRGQHSTPLVVDGRIFTTSAWSKVQSFDGKSGRLLWQFDPKVSGRAAARACCDVINRGAAYWDGRVFVGTIDGRLIALEAHSGKQLWSAQTTDPNLMYTITGAPRVAAGVVIIGNSGGDMGQRGYVTAYDVESGKQRWRFYTVPGEPGKPDGAASDAVYAKFAAKTWAGDWWKEGKGKGGGSVWNAMVYDPQLDLIFIGVGNGAVWPRQMRAQDSGINLFVASIVALRPRTGEYVWHFQQTPGDSWDFDATSNMIVTDLALNGKVRKVLMQASKNGFFYILDRATGEFISGKPFVAGVNWASGLDPVTGHPNIVAEAHYDTTGKDFTVIPGPSGAHDWQPMSYSRKTGLVYIPARETSYIVALDPHFKPLHESIYAGIDLSKDNPPDSPAEKAAAFKGLKGYLVAWDPVAGREVWRTPNPTFDNGGAMSTDGNIVVQGNTEGFLVVYNATTGAKLWEFDARDAILGAPATWSKDATQYITIVVGYGGGTAMYGGEGGWGLNGPHRNKSRVLTFALDAKGTLPPREVIPRPRLTPPMQFANADAIKLGERSFNRTCLLCHGPNAVSGGITPDLRHSAALGNKEAWTAIVANGALESMGMRSFSTTFNADEIEAIRAYVISRAEIDARYQDPAPSYSHQ
jgi:alcohol dehydrogenase (cytochrome c)/quinohemoprotein ethanol dehydrogenase